MRAYIDSRFASMAWSAGSFWPSGSAVPGHSYYLGETSGVFDGGIQGSGPQQGKAFREVKGRFNTYNNTANDIVVGAKFSLTGYTHAAVSGSALVTQHAAEKTPLRVKVTYRVRITAVNPSTGYVLLRFRDERFFGDLFGRIRFGDADDRISERARSGLLFGC